MKRPLPVSSAASSTRSIERPTQFAVAVLIQVLSGRGVSRLPSVTSILDYYWSRGKPADKVSARRVAFPQSSEQHDHEQACRHGDAEEHALRRSNPEGSDHRPARVAGSSGGE